MTTHLGRFRVLGLQLSILLACFPALVQADDSLDALNVIQISDTHICNLNSYHPLFVESRRHYGNSVPALRTFLETVPRNLDADAVVITGDLIDYFEAETSDGEMLATQIEQFYPLYESSPVPLFLTLGNHDIASYWIREEDASKADFQLNAVQARAVWIRNFHCFQQGTYYSRDYVIGTRRFHFLFLDNGYSLDGEGEILDKPQLDWLNHQVGETGDDPVVLFLHKYLPVGDKNGDGVFFGKAALDWPDERSCEKGFLRTLNEGRNIIAMFVGHGHKNVIERIDFPSAHGVIQSQTSAFPRDKNNWRLLQFKEDEIIISLPGSTQTELTISLQTESNEQGKDETTE